MLNRVGAALAKYITPISSSRTEPQVTPGDSHSEEKRFERYHQMKEQRPSASGDENQDSSGQEHSSGSSKNHEAPSVPRRVIKAGPFPDATPSSESEAPAAEMPPRGERPPMPGLSVSHAFLNLMRSIHQGKQIFAHWLGRGEYSRVRRNQRKGAHVRKGAMLDQKAE